MILVLQAARGLLEGQAFFNGIAPFSVAHPGPGVLIDAQHVRHAEEGVIAGHSGGLAHADERAAVVHKFGQLFHQLIALPGVAAAPGVPGPARVDDHVRAVQRAVFRILKGNEFHIHRQSGQGLVDVDQGVHIGFMEVAGQGPGPQAAPSVQYGHPDGQGVGVPFLLQGFDAAEFIADLLDGVHEGGVILGQVQIAAQADAVHALAQQGPAGALPVVHGVLFRVASFGEGGQPAQAHGEQIRMQPDFVGRHIGPRAQAAFKTGENALDQAVKADGGKALAIGLQAHPAVIVEHISFFAVLVHDVHQHPGLFRHESLDEFHIIPLVGGGGHMGDLQFPLIDEILGGEGIAVCLLKGLQRGGADGEIVAAPIGEAVAAAHIAAENPNEIIK